MQKCKEFLEKECKGIYEYSEKTRQGIKNSYNKVKNKYPKDFY